jgi:hypothetical protein
MAFVTLEEFFENYRIQNQQQPNETVLNKGLMRLKREVRELKSLVDILTGGNVPVWNENKIYEIDEYVSYNDLVYKSRIDRNFSKIPVSSDLENWELITLEGSSSGGGTVLKYKTFVSENGQTNFVTPFNLDSTPMVFIDGILVESERYSVISNTEISLINETLENEIITIIAGVTYDTSLVLAKERFVSVEGQYLFDTSFQIKNPSVFVDGILLDETEYVWSGVAIDLNDPLVAGKKVVVANGSVIGSSIYSDEEVNALLEPKRDKIDSYDKSEVDSLLEPKATNEYVDSEVQAVSDAKADLGTSLSDYGIEDAYNKTEVDDALVGKLNTTLFTDEIILQKIKNEHGSGSGLDADLLDGIDSSSFIRNDAADGTYFNFSIINTLEDFTGEEYQDPETRQQLITEYLASDEVLAKTEIKLDVQGENSPAILLREYDELGNLSTEHETYHTGNTSQMMVIKEGYFKGSWEPALEIDFGIENWEQYNWTVQVTPTLTGFEHDYNKSNSEDHTPYAGFDNNITWDENQSEYHYGYIENGIVKMEATHRNGSASIDIPARYQLIGVIKTFSTHEWVNGPE